MNTEQERADLLPCPFCGGADLKLFGEYAPEWWVCCETCKAATQTRANKSQAIEDWNRRAALQSQSMPPEISRDLLGGIVDQVFGGAIEDTTVIEDIYRVIACEFALQSQVNSEAADRVREFLDNWLKIRLNDKTVVYQLNDLELRVDDLRALLALQSQDREDAERLDFIEKAWFYQNPDGVWSFGFNECWDAGQHNSLRDAIDHARRVEGEE